MSTTPPKELSKETSALQEFNGQALKLVSPFRFVSFETLDGIAKNGRPYTRYVIVGSPVVNPLVKFRTVMFKNQYDQIRAILFVNPNAAIQASQERVGERTTTTFSGVLPPS